MPGHTAADAAPVAASDPGHKRRWWILAHPSGSPGAVAHPHERRRDGARRLTARRRPGPAPFAAVYLLYNASRWIFAGHLPVARQHAHEIMNLERSLHLAVEGSVQRALDWGVASWLLSNVYLAAQLVVLPGALTGFIAARPRSTVSCGTR